MSLYVKPFSQVVDDVKLEMRDSSLETSVRQKYKRRVNDIYCRDIPSKFEWDWLHKVGAVSLVAKYSTGSVTVVNGSASVVGAGTTWTTSMTGMKFTVPSTNELYTFAYTTATSGSITPSYVGADGSGLSYILFQDTYTLAFDFSKPTTEPGFYYDYSQGRTRLTWRDDNYWRRHYTTQSSQFPTDWRQSPTKTTAGLYQVEMMPPVDTARIVSYEYIKALPEMMETLATATSGGTTTKVLTTTNLYGQATVGQYLRVDTNAQWVKISAVAADTRSGDGITVDTLAIAPADTNALTISDAPDMPYELQQALFYGGCYITAIEQGNPNAQMYMVSYLRAMDLDMARRNRKRYGQQTMKHYTSGEFK